VHGALVLPPGQQSMYLDISSTATRQHVLNNGLRESTFKLPQPPGWDKSYTVGISIPNHVDHTPNGKMAKLTKSIPFLDYNMEREDISTVGTFVFNLIDSSGKGVLFTDGIHYYVDEVVVHIDEVWQMVMVLLQALNVLYAREQSLREVAIYDGIRARSVGDGNVHAMVPTRTRSYNVFCHTCGKIGCELTKCPDCSGAFFCSRLCRTANTVHKCHGLRGHHFAFTSANKECGIMCSNGACSNAATGPCSTKCNFAVCGECHDKDHNKYCADHSEEIESSILLSRFIVDMVHTLSTVHSKMKRNVSQYNTHTRTKENTHTHTHTNYPTHTNAHTHTHKRNGNIKRRKISERLRTRANAKAGGETRPMAWKWT
jgi:hypothetical protein